MKYLIIVLMLVNMLYAGASDFFGKYVFDNKRYVKTVVLDSDGRGDWTYHNSKSSAYDYEERILWRYDQGKNYIVIELLTDDADGRIQKSGQIFYLEPQNGGLLPKGSAELFKKQ